MLGSGKNIVLVKCLFPRVVGAIKRMHPDGEENEEVQKRWLEFQEIRRVSAEKHPHYTIYTQTHTNWQKIDSNLTQVFPMISQ